MPNFEVSGARSELQRLYSLHAPEKLSSIEDLLEKYSSKLDVLVQAVQEKYAYAVPPFNLDANDDEVLAHCRDHYSKLDGDLRKNIAVAAESTTLCVATSQNRLNLMMFLIDEKKVDVNAKDENQNPSKDSPIFHCRKPDLPHAARLLLAANADPNISNGFGWTPMMMNSGATETDTLEVLLKCGADVDKKTRDTAIQDACWNGAVECVEVFLQAGANLEIPGDSGWTALQSAFFSSFCNCGDEAALKIVELLFKHGAKADVLETLEEAELGRASSAMVKLLAAHGCKAAKIYIETEAAKVKTDGA